MKMQKKTRREISFDFGGSFSDLVIFEGGQVAETFHYPRAEFDPLDMENWLDGKKFDRLITVGGNQAKVPSQINRQKVHKTNEIEAIGAGGLYLSKLDKALVTSIGTGVCFVSAQKNKFTHLGGTAIGGGTILGLGKVMLNANSLDEIYRLALRGNSQKINLSVNDIVGSKIGLLPPWVPASYFAKVTEQKKVKKDDLAAGIFSLCAGSIASSLIFAARSLNFSVVVLGGRLSQNKLIRDEIKKIAKLFKIKVVTLAKAEIMTAVGAWFLRQG